MQQQQLTAPWPVVVVGAGAAGLVAAIFAARAGAGVLLLETRRQPGAKIRVSGGGRCNVLPAHMAVQDFYTSGSLHALRNIVLSWPLAQVRAFFEGDLGVPLKVEASGKLFPQSGRSKDIVAALLGEARRVGVQLRGDSRVTDLRRASDGVWDLRLHDGADLRARRLVLATGGLSLPKTGSDGAGWRLARDLGHTVVTPHPALVPLCTNDAQLRELAGVSLPVTLQVRATGELLSRWVGDFLFTHSGFSGPVVLNASRWVTAPGASAAGVEVAAHFGAGPPWPAVLRDHDRQRVGACVRETLPRRLAEVLLARADVGAERPVSELRREERERLLAHLGAFVLPVVGSEGYRTAEVTAGGVPLAEVHTRTLESRMAAGLHLAGEMLDVVGKLGGYNFLWAWVSGRRAGMAAAAAIGPASQPLSPPAACEL